jgi:uncharacterized protein YpmS
MKNSLRSNLLKLWIYHCKIWKSLNICFAFVIMDFILFITSENSKILIKKENKNSLLKYTSYENHFDILSILS